MEVVANKHSKRYPIELSYQDIGKTVSLVFSLDNAKKLLSDLDNAIKEIVRKDMTQEQKQLLLKDLCERLPYGVMVQCVTKSARIANASPLTEKLDTVLYRYVEEDNTELKPYLRPMSSMTEEEKKEYESIFSIGEYSNGGSLYGEEYEYINDSYNDVTQSVFLIDWLLAHHFDFRGLIEKGLALEAPKGMYKIK